MDEDGRQVPGRGAARRPQEELERHREHDQGGPDAAREEGDEERHHQVDERLERRLAVPADARAGDDVRGDDEQRAELELLAPGRGPPRPGAQHPPRRGAAERRHEAGQHRRLAPPEGEPVEDAEHDEGPGADDGRRREGSEEEAERPAPREPARDPRLGRERRVQPHQHRAPPLEREPPVHVRHAAQGSPLRRRDRGHGAPPSPPSQ